MTIKELFELTDESIHISVVIGDGATKLDRNDAVLRAVFDSYIVSGLYPFTEKDHREIEAVIRVIPVRAE